MRLGREILAQEEAESGSVELDSVMGDADDDKTFAAMGVAKTISTVNSFFFRIIVGVELTVFW